MIMRGGVKKGNNRTDGMIESQHYWAASFFSWHLVYLIKSPDKLVADIPGYQFACKVLYMLEDSE